MKLKFNRKIALTCFIVLMVISIVQNPFFSQLNIYVKSSELAINPTVSDGLGFQGSCLIDISIKSIQATNTSDNTIVSAYQVNTSLLNFMSLFIVFLPIVIYLYFEYIPVTIQVIKKKKVGSYNEVPSQHS